VFNGNLDQLASLAGEPASPAGDAVAKLSGDVNGDGRADLVAVNDADIWVTLSTNTAIATPTKWSDAALQGTVGNLIGDVNGDPLGDLVAVNGADIWVMLSTGTAFATPTQWSTVALQGTAATMIGDVNGDRRA